MRLLSSNPWQCFCSSCNRLSTLTATGNPAARYSTKQSDCVYIVNGPANLITAETVLDVVAVAQHLESISGTQGYALDFSIHLNSAASATPGTDKSRKDGTSGGWTPLPFSTKPLPGVREVAMTVIFGDFLSVLQSKPYASQVGECHRSSEAHEGCDNEAPTLLLQMCLDEVAASEFNEAWSIHSLSLKKGILASADSKSTTEFIE